MNYNQGLQLVKKTRENDELSEKELNAIASAASFIWRAVKQLSNVTNDPMADIWADALIEIRNVILAVPDNTDADEMLKEQVKSRAAVIVETAVDPTIATPVVETPTVQDRQSNAQLRMSIDEYDEYSPWMM